MKARVSVINDSQELGKRLRKARESRGFTQEKAAGEIGVPRTAISHIEHGTRSISVVELTKLAQLYLRPTLDFLREDAPSSDDPLAVLLRLVPELGDKPSLREQAGRFLNICRMGAGILQLMDCSPLSRPPVYEADVPRRKVDAIGQGEEFAQEERARLKLGMSPIPSVHRMLFQQGIWASDLKMPGSVSGIYYPHEAFGLAVAVNSALDGIGKRFVMAEHYAHALLDRNDGLRVSRAGASSDLVELRARSFASAFLMPKDAAANALAKSCSDRLGNGSGSLFESIEEGNGSARIRATAGNSRLTYIDVALLGHQFGVSYGSALLRIANMGMVSSKQLDHLISLEQSGTEFIGLLGVGRSKAPKEQSIDREFCFHVLNLGFEAYIQEWISRGRLLEYGTTLGFDYMSVMVLANASQQH